MTDRAALIMESMKRLKREKEPLLIAIDGRCAAGKTTLAEELRRACRCSVLHMDDFFLQRQQRTPERLKEPGGNVDYERFLNEVLLPLHRGSGFSYRPYNCHTQKMEMPRQMIPKPVNIIEGSYSCHPALWKYYDLHIFLSVGREEQLRRIALRGRETVAIFRDRWIPLEELYFSAYQIEQRCELHFS